MNCCIECFCDSEIRRIIDSVNEVGDCDFCESTGIKIYPIGKIGTVEALINSVIDEYEISESSKTDLQHALLTDWSIFSDTYYSNDFFGCTHLGNKYCVLIDLVSKLCAATRSVDDDVYSKDVIIANADDTDLLLDYGIVSGWEWEEFSDEIKLRNRFHNNLFNPEIMASFLSYAVKTYDKETTFHRARRAIDKSGLTIDKMGAPPSSKSTAGRINSEGISVLYLASDSETALNEIRASTFDFVTVGAFKANKGFRIVSLLELASISPFIYGDLWQYAINHQCLRDFSNAVSKPLRRNDSPLDYLPTQFIADFIKSERYDGVEYKSTMNPGGTNIAIFDESLFECTGVKTVEISHIQYKTEPSIE